MTRLVVLAFSMALISLVTSSAEEKEACSRSDISDLCKNYKICSQYGYITEEMRDGICLQILKDTTPTPEPKVETDPPKKTTTEPAETRTSFGTIAETGGSVQINTFFTEDTTTERVTFKKEEVATTQEPASKTLAPDITEPPVNITVSPGDAGRFECTARGSPTPQITITKKEDTVRPVFHDGAVVSTSNRVQSQTAINLIKNVAKSNEGWYTCLACNRQGCDEHDAYLHVIDLCQDVTCPRDKVCVGNYDEGVGHTCECPQYCESKERTKSAPICTNFCEDKFNVCQMKEDACKNNILGVEVLSNGYCPSIEAPVISEASDLGTLEMEEGEELELLCYADGSPTPQILWYHNGMNVGTGNELTLILSLGDSGVYVCEVTNCMTSVAEKVVAVLTVTSAPVITTVPPTPERYNDPPRSTCSVIGDPHFLSFDGRSFSYSGICSNLLAMDCEAGQWYIYGRMTACGDNLTGSCLETVTLYIGAENVELQRGWLLNRYGKKIVTKNSINEVIELENSENSITALFDGSNLKVTADLGYNKKIVINWDGYVSVQIETPRDTYTCGMCGNNDGNVDNDMTTRSRAVATNAAEFGDSWKVDPLNRCVETEPALELAEVCGDRADEVRAECEFVLNLESFAVCREELGHETEHFVRACMNDECKGQFTPQLSPKCVIAQAYAQRCVSATIYKPNSGVDGWEMEAGCPGPKEREEFVVATGCPQPSKEEESTWEF